MQDKEIAVSVVVYACHAQRTLLRCLDSLVKQSLRNYAAMEIILLDDGSQDRTHEIALAFQQIHTELIRVHRLQKSTGHAAANNIGIALAQGKYIAFCDADAWAQPDMYAALYDACEADGVQVAVCGIDQPGEQEYFPTAMLKSDALIGSQLIRRDFLAAHSIAFNETLCGGESMLFTAYSLALSERFVTVPKELYHKARRNEPKERPGLRGSCLAVFDALEALILKAGGAAEQSLSLLCTAWAAYLRQVCIQECRESKDSKDFFRRMISLAEEPQTVKIMEKAYSSAFRGEKALAAFFRAFSLRDWIRLERLMRKELQKAKLYALLIMPIKIMTERRL